jgi:hypothetical protein
MIVRGRVQKERKVSSKEAIASCSAGVATLTRDMATRAPVKYRVAETGVYAPSLRARRSARRPQ